MDNLPAENTASREKGFWFVFHDGENTIVAEKSLPTGKEYVYINGALLSEKSPAAALSDHPFRHGENQYRIVFNVNDLPAGKMECSFFVNGKRVRAYKAFLKMRMGKVILCAVLGGACGIVGNYFHVPLWIVTPLTPVMIFLFLVLFKSFRDFAFEEIGA